MVRCLVWVMGQRKEIQQALGKGMLVLSVLSVKIVIPMGDLWYTFQREKKEFCFFS